MASWNICNPPINTPSEPISPITIGGIANNSPIKIRISRGTASAPPNNLHWSGRKRVLETSENTGLVPVILSKDLSLSSNIFLFGAGSN